MGDMTRDEIRDSLMYHTNNKKHICETLRIIYDYVYELPEGQPKKGMTEGLVDAMEMAKKMQDRLAYYQKRYVDNTGNKAANIVKLTGVRERSRIRTERKKHDENNR